MTEKLTPEGLTLIAEMMLPKVPDMPEIQLEAARRVFSIAGEGIMTPAAETFLKAIQERLEAIEKERKGLIAGALMAECTLTNADSVIRPAYLVGAERPQKTFVQLLPGESLTYRLEKPHVERMLQAGEPYSQKPLHPVLNRPDSYTLHFQHTLVNDTGERTEAERHGHSLSVLRSHTEDLTEWEMGFVVSVNSYYHKTGNPMTKNQFESFARICARLLKKPFRNTY